MMTLQVCLSQIVDSWPQENSAREHVTRVEIVKVIFKVGKTSKVRFVTNSMSNLIELSSDAEFQKNVETSSVPVVLNFWASWAEPCKQMNDVFKELAEKFPAVKFVQVSNMKRSVTIALHLAHHVL
jgi:thioredoxin-like negative regulator of GroEL